MRERESDVALSHSSQTTLLFLSFSSHLSFCCLRFVVLLFPSCHLALFLLFVVLSNRSFFYSVILLFSFVVSYFSFVVFLLSLIRERRGALLFALNEESATKVIAADSSHLTIFGLK